MTDFDKTEVSAKENRADDQLDQELAEALRNYVPGTTEERKLVRKIDFFSKCFSSVSFLFWLVREFSEISQLPKPRRRDCFVGYVSLTSSHVLPCLWVMYILNYVDRTNIGNAKIAGMSKDLALTDDQYAWILSIFFFGYLICEVPSNMILSRVQPSIYLPSIMLLWGALCAVMAVSNTYAALMGFRFVLGCIESGFFPGVLYLLSCWYTRAELGKRFAIFYTAAVLSGAFGGLLAGAITSHLDLAHGIRGWKWLFIVEGVATVGVAIGAYFILLDYPLTSKRLTPEERRLAHIRIVADGISTGAVNKTRLSHWQAFVAAIADPRTYAFLVLFMLTVGAGTISYFIPTITVTLGYTTTTAQYMTVPIYVVAAVVLNIVAWSSDRIVERRWHTAAMMGVGFIGAVVCATVTQPVVRYVMICLIASGIWSSIPLVLSWTSGTISLPPEKRAIVLALVNAFGNFSSVYGSRIWPSHDSPAYRMGFGVTAGFLGAGMLLAVLVPIICKVVNWKGTKAERELAAAAEETEST